VEAVHEEHEAPAQPQQAAGEPETDSEPQLPAESVETPYVPTLVTYSEAAEAMGLSVVTIRGAANDERLKKYTGDDPRRVYVDVRECHTVFAKSRQRAGV
ncbi:MAG: hypothetical protein ACRDXB_05575, partial [Actinomycetes bacterium]